MTQADRDRLVALKKAKDKKMTQRQAAEELKISERQVRRLLAKLKKQGDKAIVPWTARPVQSQDQGGGPTEGDRDPEPGHLSRVRAHAGG